MIRRASSVGPIPGLTPGEAQFIHMCVRMSRSSVKCSRTHLRSGFTLRCIQRLSLLYRSPIYKAHTLPSFTIKLSLADFLLELALFIFAGANKSVYRATLNSEGCRLPVPGRLCYHLPCYLRCYKIPVMWDGVFSIVDV